ncbi:MAG: hypothetical protein C4583_09235 [Anaerolineaceae bacterium]|nr:MAG: hypothetical protein C4583_09235 [Anaerolineaceae bacterium]
MDAKMRKEFEICLRSLPLSEVEDTLRFLKTLLAQRKAGVKPITGAEWLAISSRRRNSLYRKWVNECHPKTLAGNRLQRMNGGACRFFYLKPLKKAKWAS